MISHLTAKLYKDKTTLIEDRDVSNPEAVLGNVARLIDLSRPACLLMGSLLHFYDLSAGRDLVVRYAAALAPGSYIVLTTVAATPGPDTDEILKIYSAGTHSVYLHSAEEFALFFGNLELVPPGVADARTWRPGWEEVPNPDPRGIWMYGAMALKAGQN